ncbi:hypothetical protein K5D69_12065 [Pseudomonas cichorii]|uniref:hypothetical protein n=1 Tax=Pseudomonas cichorii TaxID=36746 RepID=UPI001C89632C|nr:hypothetical protein [Pseudomonas cichorii]MBX8515427.1 hypothetical protein [Pseudomonas cichorii]
MNTQMQKKLPTPSLPQLNDDGALSLAQLRGSGIKVVVPVYPAMKAGDMISVPWEGTPQAPELTFPQIHTVQQVKELTLQIPYSSVYSGWKKLKIYYHVNGVGDSGALEVDIVP